MPYKSIEKRRSTHLSYRIKNKEKMHEYLLSHPCVDCGEKDIVCLEFDHINPKEKKYGISRAISGSHRSWNLIMKEIQKCEVRCANCHRKKTSKQIPWLWVSRLDKNSSIRNINSNNSPDARMDRALAF